MIDSFKEDKEANELKREVKEVLEKGERDGSGAEGKKVREVNYFEFIVDKYEVLDKGKGFFIFNGLENNFRLIFLFRRRKRFLVI